MICIVDYGVGNLKSIQNMLARGGNKSVISGSPEVIESASSLILPGMGHFDHCMRQFSASGLRPLVETKVLQQKVPVLGICVGLQMLMRASEEGNEPGLNWIDGDTVLFRQKDAPGGIKVPNMGWLEVSGAKSSDLLKKLDDARFYFAHSYHVQVDKEQDILMSAEYGYRYTVAVSRGNIYGVQFHPEKSHRFGMQLLKNFAEKINA